VAALVALLVAALVALAAERILAEVVMDAFKQHQLQPTCLLTAMR